MATALAASRALPPPIPTTTSAWHSRARRVPSRTSSTVGSPGTDRTTTVRPACRNSSKRAAWRVVSRPTTTRARSPNARAAEDDWAEAPRPNTMRPAVANSKARPGDAKALPPAFVGRENVTVGRTRARGGHHPADRLRPTPVMCGLFVAGGVRCRPIHLDQREAAGLLDVLEDVEPRHAPFPQAVAGVIESRQAKGLDRLGEDADEDVDDVHGASCAAMPHHGSSQYGDDRRSRASGIPRSSCRPPSE